jgi:hypothetical protein
MARMKDFVITLKVYTSSIFPPDKDQLKHIRESVRTSVEDSYTVFHECTSQIEEEKSDPQLQQR